MTKSLGQHVKRCNRYGTSSTTPKRPCLPTRQSVTVTSVNNDTSHRSPENCENEAATTEDLPSTPQDSGHIGTESDANITPQNTCSDRAMKFFTSPTFEQLQHRRTKLRQSIASKEQTLRNLELVKLHQTKVCTVLSRIFLQGHCVCVMMLSQNNVSAY